MIDAPSSESIATRSVQPEDQGFLVELYKSSRGDDLRGLGWDEERIQEFLDMQYEAQQRLYQSDYQQADDQIVLWEGNSAGRLIVERRDHEICCVDVALLPAHRNAGIGAFLIRSL